MLFETPDARGAAGPGDGTSPRAARKHADLIYDVGLHKGEDADFYLQKGFRVVGIEADPNLARHCRERFKAAIEAGRMTMIEGAVVDPARIRAEDVTVVFYSNLDDSVWGTALPSWADRNKRLGTRIKELRVLALDFREILAVQGIPHYLKVDIEGADRFCLEALLHFDERPEYVSIESEKTRFDRFRDEIDLFERLGYVAFQLVQQEWVSRQAHLNPPREGSYVDHTFEPGSSGLFGGELPGRWMNREEVLARYRWLVHWNRWFGDRSLLRGNLVGEKVLAGLRRLSRLPLPGWYDTHARHGSVTP